MNLFLKEILITKDWENLYNSYARKNNLNSINSKLVHQQNFQNFQNFIEAIVQKGPRKSKKRWVSNQRRILHILLNCMSVILCQPVQQFKNEQIQRINRVFPYKDKYSIEYELRKLSTNNKQNRRRWSQRQENFLQDIVKKTQTKNKWNEIARELFIYSKGEYFRQGKHCRERFYKLKSGKGQQSMSGEISNSYDSEQQNSLQFQSRNRVKQSLNADNFQGIVQSMKSVKFNVKKQVDYNQKFIQNSSHQELLDRKSQKQELIKIYQANKEKTTQQSIQDQNDPSNCSLKNKNNSRKITDKFQSLNEKNISPQVIQQMENENVQIFKPLESRRENEEKVISNIMFNPFGVNLISNQIQEENSLNGQVWFSPINYWAMGGFSFSFPGYY